MTFTAAEHAVRRQGVGASEVPAILGLDPYRTALDVFLEKRGTLPPFEGNADTAWGTLVEPVILRFYELSHPGVAVLPGWTHRHPEVEWAFASPDGLVEGPAGARWGLECKNRSFFTSREFGEQDTDQIPDGVAAQCHWQMFVTGLGRCDVAAILGGRPPVFFQLYRDEAIERRMLDLVSDFWQHVERGITPTPSARDRETLKRMFPASLGTMVEGTPEQYEQFRMLVEAKAEAKELEAQIGDLEGPLKLAIGEADGLQFADGSKVTWKSAKPSAVTDWKAVADALAAHVDAETAARVLVEHTVTRPGSRRFLTSVKKGAA